MMIFKPLIDRLRGREPLAVMGHLDPDADCICSMLAVYLAFDGEQKGWQMFLQDALPAHLDFLPGYNKIQRLDAASAPTHLLLVDCIDFARANRQGLRESALTEFWVIDHHLCSGEGRANKFIDSHAAACCELIYKLFKEAEIKLTPELALILYTGIVADTGCFRQSNTTAETLAIGSELLASGFNPEPVRINLFERRSAANIKILGKALSDMETYFDNQVCFLCASLADKKKFSASSNDCTSIVNQALTPVGAKIGVFFEEREGGDIKISLRSRNGYGVSSFAERLGGGGHLLAAGATVKGDLPQVKQQVLMMIEEKYFETQDI